MYMPPCSLCPCLRREKAKRVDVKLICFARERREESIFLLSLLCVRTLALASCCCCVNNYYIHIGESFKSCYSKVLPASFSLLHILFQSSKVHSLRTCTSTNVSLKSMHGKKWAVVSHRNGYFA